MLQGSVRACSAEHRTALSWSGGAPLEFSASEAQGPLHGVFARSRHHSAMRFCHLFSRTASQLGTCWQTNTARASKIHDLSFVLHNMAQVLAAKALGYVQWGVVGGAVFGERLAPALGYDLSPELLQACNFTRRIPEVHASALLGAPLCHACNIWHSSRTRGLEQCARNFVPRCCRA